MAREKLLNLLPESSGPVLLQGNTGVKVTGIAETAAAVKPGEVFFCVKGISKDGHDFAAEAAKNGAAALVVERGVKAP